MSKFVCTRCNWEGTEDQLIQVPVCPNCTVGHSPLWRLLKKADELGIDLPFSDDIENLFEKVQIPTLFPTGLKEIRVKKARFSLNKAQPFMAGILDLKKLDFLGIILLLQV